MFYGTYKLMMDGYGFNSSHSQPNVKRTGLFQTINRWWVCKDLLAKSDRQLTDLGFSRELLEQGVKAWPWLTKPASPHQASVFASVDATASQSPAAAVTLDLIVDEQRQAA